MMLSASDERRSAGSLSGSQAEEAPPPLAWPEHPIEPPPGDSRVVMGRVNRMLGLPWAPELNWKGRSIERMLVVSRLIMRPVNRVRTAPSLFVGRVDRVLGLPAAPQLNWKGRAIERMLAVSRLIIRANRLDARGPASVLGARRSGVGGAVGAAAQLEGPRHRTHARRLAPACVANPSPATAVVTASQLERSLARTGARSLATDRGALRAVAIHADQ